MSTHHPLCFADRLRLTLETARRQKVRSAEEVRGAGTVRLACGHVEAELRPAAGALESMQRLLAGVRAGTLGRRVEDDEVASTAADNTGRLLLSCAQSGSERANQLCQVKLEICVNGF